MNREALWWAGLVAGVFAAGQLVSCAGYAFQQVAPSPEFQCSCQSSTKGSTGRCEGTAPADAGQLVQAFNVWCFERGGRTTSATLEIRGDVR